MLSTVEDATQAAMRAVRARSAGTPWVLAAAYEYRDARGLEHMRVLRFETPDGRKTFTPISRSGSGWVLGDPPGLLPLYRLPELRGAARLYVVEGEKAADSARELGLVATTSAHGASAAAKADWSPVAGKDVVILPDNDVPGERYAQDVGLVLTKLDPPAQVRIVKLPELPASGDLVEFVRQRTGAGISQTQLLGEIESYVAQAPLLECAGDRLQPAYVPFPFHVLPEGFVSFVSVSSRSIGCDPAYVALPLLAVCASAIGHSREIEIKAGWREPAVLWTIIVGDSGTLKSPALELALQPLRKLQKEAFERHERERAKYDEEFLDYAREYRRFTSGKRKNKPGPKPTRPKAARLIVSDTTTEALAEVLAANGYGVLLHRDELSGWFGSFDRYTQRRGADASFWLEAYGARPSLIDRKTGKNKTIVVPRTAVSITGGIQPGVLARSIGQSNIENGLAARFLMAMPPKRRKRWTDTEIDKRSMDVLLDTVQFLHRQSPDQTADGESVPKPLRFSASGRAAWIEFYDEHAALQAGAKGHEAAALAKLEGAVARIALVIHEIRVVTQDPLLESDTEVDEKSVRAGAELVRWFRNENKRIYAVLAPEVREGAQAKLIRKVQEVGGTISIRAWQRTRSHRTAEDAERELQGLVDAGVAHWSEAEPSGNGRPAGKLLRLGPSPVHTDADSDSASDETDKTDKRGRAAPRAGADGPEQAPDSPDVVGGDFAGGGEGSQP